MEINDLKKYLRNFLIEGLSEEKYLDNLTNLILKYVAKKLLEKEDFKIFANDKQDMFIMTDSIFKVNSNLINTDGFPEDFQKWIDFNGGIEIIFTTHDEASIDKKSSLGSYQGWNSIKLVYKSDISFREIWLLLNDKYISFGDRTVNPDVTDIYVKLYYLFFKILLHELRHAYDDYRTKGK